MLCFQLTMVSPNWRFSVTSITERPDGAGGERPRGERAELARG